jgi:type IV secretory pathway VirB10-like protein
MASMAQAAPADWTGEQPLQAADRLAVLSSAFAAGIEVSQTHNNAAPYGYPTAGQMAGAAVGAQMGEFGRRITERNLNRPPTIQLKPGTRFNVREDRDIVFAAPFH